MSRPRKRLEFDPEKNMKEFTEAITEAYLLPPAELSDEEGHLPLKYIAEEFKITPLKVRKILITSGAYHTELSDKVNELVRQDKSVQEIQRITGLGRASVHGYLPYAKGIYNMEELSLEAERLIRYRKRKSAVENLNVALQSNDLESIEDALWTAMTEFQKYPFKTARGLNFNYEIKGNEIFFNRKEKSVTKSTVNIALETVIELKNKHIPISGPKKLGCFGASYIYPIFIRFMII